MYTLNTGLSLFGPYDIGQLCNYGNLAPRWALAIGMCGFVIADNLHLCGTPAFRIEGIPKPLFRQPPRQFYANNPLTHTKYLSVVAHDRSFHTETVMSRDCSYSRDFVCADGNSQSRSTDQQSAIRFAG